MATFSNEEVEKLKSMGNEENSKIWLGLHDGPVKFEPVRLDENVKAHLIQKYENRKWYVSPSEIAEQKRLLEAHARRDSISGNSINSHKSNQSAPANLLQSTERKQNDFVDFLGGDLMFPTKEEPTITNKHGFQAFQQQQAFPLSHTSTPQPLQFDLFNASNNLTSQESLPPVTPRSQDLFGSIQPPGTIQKPQQNHDIFGAIPSNKQQQNQDLFGSVQPQKAQQNQDLFGANFFDVPTPPQQSASQTKSGDNFANFDAIFGNLSVNDSSKPTPSEPFQQQKQPPLPSVAPVSNGFMDFPSNTVKPVATVSLDSTSKAESILNKVEERKDDGPDYSALDSVSLLCSFLKCISIYFLVVSSGR